MKQVYAWAGVLALVLSGCPQNQVPASQEAAQAAAPETVPQETPAPEAAPVAQAPTPTYENIFPNLEACEQAGYSPQQCQRAMDASQSMHQMDAPVYAKLEDCTRYFSKCAPQNQAGVPGATPDPNAVGDRFAPLAEGFVMLGEEKSDGLPEITPEKPVVHTAIYLNAKRDLVVIVRNTDNHSITLPSPVSR